jgi:hypothetical protein
MMSNAYILGIFFIVPLYVAMGLMLIFLASTFLLQTTRKLDVQTAKLGYQTCISFYLANGFLLYSMMRDFYEGGAKLILIIWLPLMVYCIVELFSLLRVIIPSTPFSYFGWLLLVSLLPLTILGIAFIAGFAFPSIIAFLS